MVGIIEVAYYVTQVEDVYVVNDVQVSSEEEYELEKLRGYNMATDELESVDGLPWKSREEGWGVQVHARMLEE